MKNPLTLAGIEPATIQFVAQHLNHCATAVPMDILGTDYKTNAQIAKELKITPILDKLLEYKRS